jgi:hypothetical protein
LAAPASIFCTAATLTLELLDSRRSDQWRASRNARISRPSERRWERSKRISAALKGRDRITGDVNSRSRDDLCQVGDARISVENPYGSLDFEFSPAHLAVEFARAVPSAPVKYTFL